MGSKVLTPSDSQRRLPFGEIDPNSGTFVNRTTTPLRTQIRQSISPVVQNDQISGEFPVFHVEAVEIAEERQSLENMLTNSLEEIEEPKQLTQELQDIHDDYRSQIKSLHEEYNI